MVVGMGGLWVFQWVREWWARVKGQARVGGKVGGKVGGRVPLLDCHLEDPCECLLEGMLWNLFDGLLFEGVGVVVVEEEVFLMMNRDHRDWGDGHCTLRQGREWVQCRILGGQKLEENQGHGRPAKTTRKTKQT